MTRGFQGTARPQVGFQAPGFTLVESAISIVLVSVLLVAALDTVGASKLGQLKTMERGRGHLLAQALLSEIMRQSYADPEDVGPIDLTAGSIPAYSMAPDSGESGVNRADFDDVDDYLAWTSQPPENKDGTPITGLTDWKRSVTVERLSWADVTQMSASEEGLKRITVTVEYKGVQVAQLVAIKGAGLPPAPTGPMILFVVNDEANLTAQELARQTLMESWGFTVNLIAAVAPQTDFDAAVANVDAAYVSEEINHADLDAKLRDTPIGVVNEERSLHFEFGVSDQDGDANPNSDEIDILGATHYITSPFNTGFLAITASPQTLIDNRGNLGTVTNLADLRDGPNALLAQDVGDALWGGGTAAARRVHLPWGGDDFDINTLNADGQTIMKRAIEWAAGMEQP